MQGGKLGGSHFQLLNEMRPVGETRGKVWLCWEWVSCLTDRNVAERSRQDLRVDQARLATLQCLQGQLMRSDRCWIAGWLMVLNLNLY
ncbi:hypothetical protein B0T49_12815 [Chromobacterium violaceum]|nr:hypothetical protein B0T41_19065 [Chromobacterium violaceum]OQS48377.1 hypothetical protein B0T48_10415 [Chromobacterium violaceum]OQS49706.1 hypothetical protein B0T49_12815 [Chromobacterium violaceum]